MSTKITINPFAGISVNDEINTMIEELAKKHGFPREINVCPDRSWAYDKCSGFDIITDECYKAWQCKYADIVGYLNSIYSTEIPIICILRRLDGTRECSSAGIWIYEHSKDTWSPSYSGAIWQNPGRFAEIRRYIDSINKLHRSLSAEHMTRLDREKKAEEAACKAKEQALKDKEERLILLDEMITRNVKKLCDSLEMRYFPERFVGKNYRPAEWLPAFDGNLKAQILKRHPKYYNEIMEEALESTLLKRRKMAANWKKAERKKQIEAEERQAKMLARAMLRLREKIVNPSDLPENLDRATIVTDDPSNASAI